MTLPCIWYGKKRKEKKRKKKDFHEYEILGCLCLVGLLHRHAISMLCMSVCMCVHPSFEKLGVGVVVWAFCITTPYPLLLLFAIRAWGTDIESRCGCKDLRGSIYTWAVCSSTFMRIVHAYQSSRWIFISSQVLRTEYISTVKLLCKGHSSFPQSSPSPLQRRRNATQRRRSK